MKIVSVFLADDKRAIHIPEDMDFSGVTELGIERKDGIIILRPIKPSWTSLGKVDKADDDFLAERPDVIEERMFFSDDKTA